MTKEQTYYVELENGYCSLVEASSEAQAMRRINADFSKREREHQGCKARMARIATADDTAWVTGMQGGAPL